MNPATIVLVFGLAALVASTGLASAQDDATPPIDQITASPLEPGGDRETLWVISRDDLERDYPAVARAVGRPNMIVEVEDDEQATTHAFFEESARRGANAISVDGSLYSVGISIASGGAPAAGETGAGETRGDARSVPAASLVGAVGALAAAAAAVGVSKR